MKDLSLRESDFPPVFFTYRGRKVCLLFDIRRYFDRCQLTWTLSTRCPPTTELLSKVDQVRICFFIAIYPVLQIMYTGRDSITTNPTWVHCDLWLTQTVTRKRHEENNQKESDSTRYLLIFVEIIIVMFLIIIYIFIYCLFIYLLWLIWLYNNWCCIKIYCWFFCYMKCLFINLAIFTFLSDSCWWLGFTHPGLIIGLRPANERRRYLVTTSLIGWAQALKQPCSSRPTVSKDLTDVALTV